MPAASRPWASFPGAYDMSAPRKNDPEIGRIEDLTDDGFPEIPVLGLTRYRKTLDAVKEHVHVGVLEISCCRRGELSFECGGHRYPFRPGICFITQPGERHRLSARLKGTMKYWMFCRLPRHGGEFLGLPRAEVAALADRLREIPKCVFDHRGAIHRAFVRLFKVYDDPAAKDGERSLQLRHAIVGLLLALTHASQIELEMVPSPKLTAIVAEMERNPERDYPVDELSARTALSPSSLLRQFRQLMGVPPHAYLIGCRIARAKKDLLRGDKSVEQIASSLGFATARHFVTQFKNATGLPPLRWARDQALNSHKEQR